MAQGSDVSIHLQVDEIKYHKEALEFASMGLVPAGAYRNRTYASASVKVSKDIPLAMLDILYDPQTSGGLLMAIPEEEGAACLNELIENGVEAFMIGKVKEKDTYAIYLE